MKLTKRYLTGKEHLSTVTDLLQRIRLEGVFAGLYEAADLQWWWREDDAALPDRQQYWFNADDTAIACCLRFDAGDEWNNDFISLPSARQVVNEQVIPQVIAEISQLDKTSTITVRADDLALQNALARVGFTQSDTIMMQSELATDPAATQLASGFHLTSRVEDALPHHLMRRNGNQIVAKLQECSIYRPDLDLCIRDSLGNVAAYALFWMDDVTKVGLLEPLRTEANFRRLGLARHLITNGIARLRGLGAESIRVAYTPNNEAAAPLYRQMGFVDRIKRLEYKRPSSQ